MKLSRECRYALVGLTTLASKPPGTVMGAAALSEEAGLPPPFMAKILQQLAKRGVLISYRVSPRGYVLARPAGEITVREVLAGLASSMAVKTTCAVMAAGISASSLKGAKSVAERSACEAVTTGKSRWLSASARPWPGMCLMTGITPPLM